MPLWNIHHPVGAYTPADKQAFAEAVTATYTPVGLPAFYVVVLFHEVEPSSCFVGGEPSGNTVRIAVDHIARHLDDGASRRAVAERLDRVVAPWTHDRGLHCELHVDETSRDLWRIAGQAPPEPGSEQEQLWARENRPVPLGPDGGPEPHPWRGALADLVPTADAGRSGDARNKSPCTSL